MALAADKDGMLVVTQRGVTVRTERERDNGRGDYEIPI